MTKNKQQNRKADGTGKQNTKQDQTKQILK